MSNYNCIIDMVRNEVVEGIVMIEFTEKIKTFVARVEKLKDQVQTEESTKTSLIMPFFQLLGYDVFNPLEFVPEFIADVGIKKGEKVDYAIIIDDRPTIIIEAKYAGENLDKHGNQILRYFAMTPAKFGILTNGIEYRFYTDLAEVNKMDQVPFFSVNLLDLKDSQINELKKFHKSAFDVDKVFATAENLKYTNQIKSFMQQQIEEPDDDFVAYISNKVYDGRKTKTIIDKFRPIVKKSLNQFLNELVNDRLTAALNRSGEVEKEEPEVVEVEEVSEEKPKKTIITTQEEWEAFAIIKVMLKDIVPVNKITSKDTQSYFGVLYDNNTWKWICRLMLEGNKKYLCIPDENKNPQYYMLEDINDLFNYAEQIKNSVKRFVSND